MLKRLSLPALLIAASAVLVAQAPTTDSIYAGLLHTVTPRAITSTGPVSGAVNVPLDSTLSWSGYWMATCDLYFGPSNPPARVGTVPCGSWTPPTPLLTGTQYWWRVVAVNAAGRTVGGLWNFRTAIPSPPPNHTTALHAGSDLQAAINAAVGGDTLVLDAGAKWSGNFTLPAKSGTGVVTITSSGTLPTPSPGRWILPSDAPQLATIETPNSAPAIATKPNGSHYAFVGLEIRNASTLTYDTITCGDGSAAQNSLSLVPQDLTFDRIYLHDQALGGGKRGLALNCANATLTNSYVSGYRSLGQDSQAAGGWNGPGPFTITNNYLEAASENVIFGGADPVIPNLVPSDIIIRGNHFAKPVAWKALSGWAVKNILELKNARRVTIDGNLFENNWPDAQNGFSILFTVRNQDGTAPWSDVSDVTFTNNVLRHVAAGLNFLGQDGPNVSQVEHDIVVRNNLIYDVSGANWGGNGWAIMTTGGTKLTIDHNTVLNDGGVTLGCYGAANPSLTFTNNILQNNSWAIFADGGLVGNTAIASCFPGSTITGNAIAGADVNQYPAANFYPSGLAALGFTNVAAGDYSLLATSPYHNAGTDGKDVGADLAAIKAKIPWLTLP